MSRHPELTWSNPIAIDDDGTICSADESWLEAEYGPREHQVVSALLTALDDRAELAAPSTDRERMALHLRAAELRRELASIDEALAGHAANPPRERQRRPRVVHPRPASVPTDINAARAKKIMRERGML